MNLKRDDLPDLHDAACIGSDPELFFYDVVPDECGWCPARERCLGWALEREEWGIWGGTTEEQRRQLGRKGRTRPMSREHRRLIVSDLHAQGLPDGAIAEHLAMSKTVVQGDRNVLGLAANVPNYEERRSSVAELHAQGLSDRQIAERLGITREQARHDREIQGLANNYHHKQPTGDVA